MQKQACVSHIHNIHARFMAHVQVIVKGLDVERTNKHNNTT